jgi:hypothetical protein
MASQFQLSRTKFAFLVLNLIVLGGCIVLLFVTVVTGPLILLTIGALGLALGKIGAGFRGSGQSPPAEPDDSSSCG